MLELLTDITEGRGTMEHLDMLEELSRPFPYCALRPWKNRGFPVVSTMKYFRDEYISHVVDKKCPAGQCKALVNLQIDPELCKGCTKCARLCPVSAITGELKSLTPSMSANASSAEPVRKAARSMQSADLGRRYTVGIFTGNCESIG